MIMSGQMLLAWLGRKRGEARATAAADKIKAAVDKVVTEAEHVTKDLGGKASTQEMGDAIAAAVAAGQGGGENR
jgi:3-isopropylmalate dehydrogenase